MPRYFNPRLQEGGDRHHTIRRKRGTDFNPRLQEGGDVGFPPTKHLISISIHASKKEATLPLCLRSPSAQISIHASKKEATFLCHPSIYLTFIFQSTPPRRRRLQHIVIPQLSCTYLASTTFLFAIFSFISQYVILFFFF